MKTRFFCFGTGAAECSRLLGTPPRRDPKSTPSRCTVQDAGVRYWRDSFVKHSPPFLVRDASLVCVSFRHTHKKRRPRVFWKARSFGQRFVARLSLPSKGRHSHTQCGDEYSAAQTHSRTIVPEKTYISGGERIRLSRVTGGARWLPARHALVLVTFEKGVRWQRRLLL